MSSTDFGLDDNWSGGFYELALELGPGSDERLTETVEAIWSTPALDGCWNDRWSVRPTEENRVPCRVERFDEPGHLYGIATLPTGARCVCGTVIVRESDGPDWVDLYLPTGALERADSRVGAYPFDDPGASREWREPLDAWLASIASSVFSRVPFVLGLIGFEVSGAHYASELASGIPQDRFMGYLSPEETGIRFFAANRFDSH